MNHVTISGLSGKKKAELGHRKAEGSQGMWGLRLSKSADLAVDYSFTDDERRKKRGDCEHQLGILTTSGMDGEGDEQPVSAKKIRLSTVMKN